LAQSLQASEKPSLPAEELLLFETGGDYGWPECYYDGIQRKLVLAPEYGGDGGKQVGVCANKIAPRPLASCSLGANAMVRCDKKQFRPTIGMGSSAPFTVRGIVRHTRRADIT
jgi:hypothetical protein